MLHCPADPSPERIGECMEGAVRPNDEIRGIEGLATIALPRRQRSRDRLDWKGAESKWIAAGEGNAEITAPPKVLERRRRRVIDVRQRLPNLLGHPREELNPEIADAGRQRVHPRICDEIHKFQAQRRRWPIPRRSALVSMA